MHYRWTTLNIISGLFLVGCVVYTIIDYGTLSAHEGWGVVFMVGLAAFGIGALVVDLILQQFIRNKETLNLVGVILALMCTAFIIFS